MDRAEKPSGSSCDAAGATPHSPLCPACRQEVDGDIRALCSQVRGALLALSRGGGTGLVLHHFDDALQGLACLAGFQQQGVLGSTPDLAALRRLLASERHSVVSAAIAARTSPFRCLEPRPEERPWNSHASSSPLVDVALGQLAAVHIRPCGVGSPGAGPGGRPEPAQLSTHAGAEEQRGDPRTGLCCPVVMTPGDRGATAVDLSPGGAGLRSDQFLDVGTRVWITFCRRCRLEVEGVVRWSTLSGGPDGPPSGPTAGVQFCSRLSTDTVGEFSSAGRAA